MIQDLNDDVAVVDETEMIAMDEAGAEDAILTPSQFLHQQHNQ
jgi:hypothetical protein